mgnify:CR=1 FL=1
MCFKFRNACLIMKYQTFVWNTLSTELSSCYYIHVINLHGGRLEVVTLNVTIYGEDTGETG